MRPRRAAAVIAASIPLVLGGFLLQSKSARSGAHLFDEVRTLVSTRFVDSLDASALYERAATGMVAQLDDPYAELYTPERLRQFTLETNGRYAGVGMTVEDQNGKFIVSRVYPGSPAAGAGVLEGDEVVRVDTMAAHGKQLPQVTSALKGKAGTHVAVTFARIAAAQPIHATFVRAVIHIPAVPYVAHLESGIGYIPILQINETAAMEVAKAVLGLERGGAKGIVLDMRGNGGGIVEQALAISNLFLQPGQQIVTVRGRGDPVETIVAQDRPLAPTIPLVILSDEGSASATEIIAGALQDHDRALVVGSTSFGKGLVQTVFPLDGGYALKMTTGKWYTPSGRSIHRDRKLVNGRLLEEVPDSLETDSVKASRPKFRSDAKRVVYGGGGITPDLIVQPDTLSKAEQDFVKAILPQTVQVYNTLFGYAFELRSQVKPDFVVPDAWRDEFYKRLQTAGVKLDRTTYDAGQAYVDRLLAHQVAHFAFGDAAAKVRELGDDAQLRRAVDLLRQAHTQPELLALGERTAHRS